MSESRQVAHDLTDTVGFWLRESKHIKDVPHALVMETRNGPLHLEMRGANGRSVTIEIPRDKAVEARTSVSMGRESSLILDAAKSGVAEIMAGNAPQPTPVTSEPDKTPAQDQVLVETDRINAANARAEARRTRSA